MINIPDLGAIRDWCLSKFQQKESGKGLSTNDYTTAEKKKLAALPETVTEQVQADWNETDVAAKSYIKNKPAAMETAALTYEETLAELNREG